jgi:hypothetical protein
MHNEDNIAGVRISNWTPHHSVHARFATKADGVRVAAPVAVAGGTVSFARCS